MVDSQPWRGFEYILSVTKMGSNGSLFRQHDDDDESDESVIFVFDCRQGASRSCSEEHRLHRLLVASSRGDDAFQTAVY